jgi:hypothetical protein
MINFIGIGAQKSGTSWVYACLYEHPEICAPIKEIHFFSRPRYAQGIAWYESHFKKCDTAKLCGEFSTSYLYSKEAPGRIFTQYPDAKLIAIVRNPVTRAVSQFQNAIKAGEIAKNTSFSEYSAGEKSVLDQGLYFEQLSRYVALFKKEQLLVLVYEDSKKNPEAFIKTIYEFLGVDSSFVPSMLLSQINVARVPRMIVLERAMHHIAESMRKVGLDRVVHGIRSFRIPDLVRSFNTQAPKEKNNIDTATLTSYFVEDTNKLSELLQRDVSTEWGITP